MEFKIKRFIFIFLVPLISQFLFSGNPQILKSSENPVYGNLILKLKKDLILGEEAPGPYLFASVNGIEVSDKYIYVLDLRMAKVRVYDLKGKFIRDIGRKGQGPGEFMAPTNFCLSANGDLFVYDIMARRITIFDSEGGYKSSFHIEEPSFGNRIYVDSDNYIYRIFSDLNVTDLKRYLNFGKLSSQGKSNKIFYKTFNLTAIHYEEEGFKGNLVYDHPYIAHLYFTNIQGDTFVLMNSMRYELILFSKDGDILSKILKDEKPVKVTKEEKETVFTDYLKENVPKHLHKYVTFSETRPYCSNLLSDENRRIYVERFKPVTEKGGPYTYEIFNQKGEYLYRLTLDFKIELIKNGYIYTVSTDEETGQIKIIRYRVENWNEIKF